MSIFYIYEIHGENYTVCLKETLKWLYSISKVNLDGLIITLLELPEQLSKFFFNMSDSCFT